MPSPNSQGNSETLIPTLSEKNIPKKDLVQPASQDRLERHKYAVRRAFSGFRILYHSPDTSETLKAKVMQAALRFVRACAGVWRLQGSSSLSLWLHPSENPCGIVSVHSFSSPVSPLPPRGKSSPVCPLFDPFLSRVCRLSIVLSYSPSCCPSCTLAPRSSAAWKAVML